MELQKILALMEKKYPDGGDSTKYAALVLFIDGSGRITRNIDRPYIYVSEFEFSSIDELISYLQEKK